MICLTTQEICEATGAEALVASASTIRGEVVIDPKVIAHMLAHDQSPVARLTGRQREVLSLMAQGRTNAQISEALYVSAATLERTISQIFSELGLAETEGNRRVLAVLEYLKGHGR